MSNLPASIFLSIVADAARRLPPDTGESAKYNQRVGREGAFVVLADCSASMAEPVSGKTTKHTVLVDALKQMRPDRVIGFSDVAVLVTELPPPSGGTDIAGAIAAASCHQPARTLLISDGQPNDKKAAEDSAARLPGVLDVLYIGPETDREASDWLRSLAKTCCGTYAAYDVVREANPKALETRILALGSGR